jgi:hypothetical protein
VQLLFSSDEIPISRSGDVTFKLPNQIEYRLIVCSGFRMTFPYFPFPGWGIAGMVAEKFKGFNFYCQQLSPSAPCQVHPYHD